MNPGARRTCLLAFASLALAARAAAPSRWVVLLRWQAVDGAAGPPGDRQWRAGPSGAPPDWPALQVDDGQEARWSEVGWEAVQALDWIWTAQGAGLQGGTRWRERHTRLVLTPRGRGRQVELGWAVDRPSGEGEAATRQSLGGRLTLAPGQWVTLAEARAAGPSATPGTGWSVGTRPAARGWRLQARVERP